MTKVFMCLLLFLASCYGIKDYKTLELVHVLFRHGDRTPDKNVIYPKDPHINETYHPVGYGQLTNAGKRKQYLLGKALRKRYGKFLGFYNIETVDGRSTDYNRTKMSLQLVLASLFPPENELIWEKSLKWQPIPFNYWPVQGDHVLGDPYVNCPRYKKLYDDFYASDERHKLFKNYTIVKKYLKTHAGIATHSKDMAEIYFTLTTELENGLKLPTWTNSVYPHILADVVHLEYLLCTATHELRRLSSGFLLNKIISDTTKKIQSTLPRNRKIFLYSAHEFNLAYMLRLLGVYYPHVPSYGGYLAFEIHNRKGVRGVKIFYQDYSTGKPKRLKLPHCANFCKFERFIDLYKEYLVESASECDL